MKSVFAQDGTIGGSGDIGAIGGDSPDFTVLDQGVVVVPARTSETYLAAAISPGTPVSADSVTSAANVIANSSGGTVASDLVSGPTVVTSSVIYAPLVITPVFESSITSLTGSGGDPTTAAEVEGAIDAAINYYEGNWTSSVPVGSVINHTTVSTVDVTIDFEYGAVGGAAASTYGLTTFNNYASLYAIVSGRLPNFPATNPTNGGTIWETSAQADVLGIAVAGSTAVGTVTLNSVAGGGNLDYNLSDQSMAGEIGAVGATEHEIAEVFGRTALLGGNTTDGGPANGYSIMDLYRFTAANTPALVPGSADYFSLNSGTTALGYFDNNLADGGDAGDWVSSGTHDVVADAFDAFITAGTAGTISNLDTMVLTAIGLRQNTSPAPRTLTWAGAQGASFAAAADWNDIPDGLYPAQSAPNATDTALFVTGGGVISGAGTAATLEFGGSVSWNVTSGASLSAATGVTVGQGGIGALLINGGASVNGLGASDIVSGGTGETASVTVDGAGSAWKSAGALIVGGGGAGGITVSNAASLSAVATGTSPAIALGASSGGNGSLLVTGTASATLTGQLNVGQSGGGTITVSNQGTLRTGNDAALDPAEGFDIAQQAGASGVAVVTGAKSLLSNSGRFVVGDAGMGSLSIAAGATVITTPDSVSGLAGAVVANQAGAVGSSVNVSGSGSNWQVGGLLDVGVAGSGALQLSNGASVTASSLDAANVASAVAQISLSGSGTGFTVTGSATVADDGTGVLSVLNGATFSAQSLTIGSQSDSSGALVVSGDGSKVLISGELNIGTAAGTGDLTVGPGATVDASVVNLQGGVVLEGGELDPTVYIENGGSTTGGFGTIASDFILLEGTILSNGSKSGKQTEVVQGTVVGGGTADIKGSVSVNGPGILQIGTHDTIELTGAVLNTATTTFTDNLTPTGTYTVNNSVIDVVFQDSTGVLQLDDIGGFAGTVATWHAGDSFIATGETLSNPSVVNGDTLQVRDTGPNAGAGGIDSIIFASPIVAGGFSIVNNNTLVACFAAGTRIQTADGPVAVEDLRVGDRIVTAGPQDGAGLDGECQPIVWIGQRDVNCRAHPAPETVWPVRVRAGAFGENVPIRDLYLSPDHAVFVNDVLVPVKLLINGRTIAQVSHDHVRYFHVELPRHAVILAEGLTVESYLDAGDRANVQQAGGTIRLFPDFAARLAPETALLWETLGVARLVLGGPELQAARLVLASCPVRPDAIAWRESAAS